MPWPARNFPPTGEGVLSTQSDLGKKTRTIGSASPQDALSGRRAAGGKSSRGRRLFPEHHRTQGQTDPELAAAVEIAEDLGVKPAGP